jgi:ubiquinone/menaquinone biosynthesis C-methylase UbiE
MKTELVCPLCKSELIWQPDQVECQKNHHKFIIREGVPDFLVLAWSEFKNERTDSWWRELRHFQEWNKGYDLTQAEFDLKTSDEVQRKIGIEGKVLDIGGSIGLIRRYLKAGSDYYVIDPDDQAFSKIEILKNLYPEIVKPFNFIVGVGEFLPFRDASFDTVIMRSVIEHFYDVDLVMKEVYRILRPGGKLIIGIGLPLTKPSEVWQRIKKIFQEQGLKSLVSKIFNKFFGKQRHVGHLHKFNLDSLCGLLKKYQFDSITAHHSKVNPAVYFFESVKI